MKNSITFSYVVFYAFEIEKNSTDFFSMLFYVFFVGFFLFFLINKKKKKKEVA